MRSATHDWEWNASLNQSCICRIVKVTPHQIQCDVELLDDEGKLLARMDGYQCITDGTLKDAFLDNQLEQKVQA